MIQQESRLAVADNSGAKEVLCIRVLGGTKKRYARIGDQIVVSVKSALPSGESLKGGNISKYAVRLRKEDQGAYDRIFSGYLKKGKMPEEISNYFEEARKKIVGEI